MRVPAVQNGGQVHVGRRRNILSLDHVYLAIAVQMDDYFTAPNRRIFKFLLKPNVRFTKFVRFNGFYCQFVPGRVELEQYVIIVYKKYGDFPETIFGY